MSNCVACRFGRNTVYSYLMPEMEIPHATEISFAEIHPAEPPNEHEKRIKALLTISSFPKLIECLFETLPTFPLDEILPCHLQKYNQSTGRTIRKDLFGSNEMSWLQSNIHRKEYIRKHPCHPSTK